jgi:CHASE2 domain-containing sensor protein/signal transduction histidine kinase
MSWLVLAMAALAVVIGLDDSYTLRQPNRFLQDALIASQGREVRDGKVVIVEMDEKSLEALGPWPWRKMTHARLIDRIAQDAPLAIGLDILLTDPDAEHPDDDKALANALKRSGKVVLTAMLQSEGGNPLTIEPIGCLAQTAARVGLDRLPVDEDGVSRDVYLHEGLPGFEFDHFSLAMLKVGDPQHAFEAPWGSPKAEELPHTPPSGQWVDWRRSHRMIVPFAGPAGHFLQVSYIDVLTDSVPPDTFRGKYVLVGTTAPALGNLYATPVSAKRNLMPGVEVNANVLDSLLRHHEVSPAPTWLNMALNISAVLLALIGMAFLEPLAALLLTCALALLLPLATALGNVLLQLQFAPAAGMLGLGVAYALWSWSQLNAATRYLIDASRHLRASVSTARAPTDRKRLSGDFLDRRIKALIRATEHLRDLHQLVSDSLDNLPDVTLVCDRRGHVRLANAAAARYFNAAAAATALSGASAVELMRHIRFLDDHQPVVTSDSLAQPPVASVVSARDEHAHDLLVKRVPSLNAKGQHMGWIVSLVDVTELHRIQRQRDSALHFLSHDLRAPQTAILTLLTLRKHSPEAMTQMQLEERIERHAQKALLLSEGFIQLMRAQSQHYHFEPCDLSELLLECIDDAWEACQRKEITVEMARCAQEPFSRVDRDLVSRAIGNLLGNALKHAPVHSTITCAVERHAGDWAILVQDQGPGIASDRQAAVFEPFARIRSSVRADGAGLGLAFVKTVASRHGGAILLNSVPGRGCAFRLVLPRAAVGQARSLQD